MAMPNRYIRESAIESERVNALSWQGEVFYRRLLNRADDFGRYTANPALLRASLFPLQLDKVSDRDVNRLLEEAEGCGLLATYGVGGKRYLVIARWEKGRAKESKYPPPPPDVCERLQTYVYRPRQTHADAPDSDTDSDSDPDSGSRSARARAGAEAGAGAGGSVPPSEQEPDGPIEPPSGNPQEATQGASDPGSAILTLPGLANGRPGPPANGTGHPSVDPQPRNPPNASPDAAIPTLIEVLTFASARGIPEATARAFFDHYEGNQLWRNRHDRIINWRHKLGAWAAHDRGGSRSPGVGRPPPAHRNDFIAGDLERERQRSLEAVRRMQDGEVPI